MALCVICGDESEVVTGCQMCGEKFCPECGDADTQLCTYCGDDRGHEDWDDDW